MIKSTNPIRVWRTARQMELKELADKLKIHPSILSRVERDLQAPSLELALRISRLTKIPVEKLVRAA